MSRILGVPVPELDDTLGAPRTRRPSPEVKMSHDPEFEAQPEGLTEQWGMRKGVVVVLPALPHVASATMAVGAAVVAPACVGRLRQ